MTKLRNKKVILIIVSVVLAVVIALGVPLGIHCYKEYNEEAVLTHEFLPYPDAITIHYNDNGRAKSKKATQDEIGEIYNAFEELMGQYLGILDYKLPMRIPSKDDGKKFKNTFKERGGVEFHYDQRRLFECSLSLPLSDDAVVLPNDKYKNKFFFNGTYDSVIVGFMENNSHVLSFGGCRNGTWFPDSSAPLFSRDEAEVFWTVVKSCVE